MNYTVSCSGDNVTCPPYFTTTDNTTKSYTITNLTPMTNYTFSVVATNSIGSGEAGVVMITTPFITNTTTSLSMGMSTTTSSVDMTTTTTTSSVGMITSTSSVGMTTSTSSVGMTTSTSSVGIPTSVCLTTITTFSVDMAGMYVYKNCLLMHIMMYSCEYTYIRIKIHVKLYLHMHVAKNFDLNMHD